MEQNSKISKNDSNLNINFDKKLLKKEINYSFVSNINELLSKFDSDFDFLLNTFEEYKDINMRTIIKKKMQSKTLISSKNQNNFSFQFIDKILLLLTEIHNFIKNKNYLENIRKEYYEIFAILNYFYKQMKDKNNWKNLKNEDFTIFKIKSWDLISFYLLSYACIEKLSTIIYCKLSNKIKIIINNKDFQEATKYQEIQKNLKSISFDNFLNFLKKENSLNDTFDSFSEFHKKIVKSFFWRKINPEFRNRLLHSVLNMNEETINIYPSFVLNIYISIKVISYSWNFIFY